MCEFGNSAYCASRGNRNAEEVKAEGPHHPPANKVGAGVFVWCRADHSDHIYPNGNTISRTEGNDGAYVMNADGSDERELVDFAVLEPAWSPDSTRIVFGSNHEGFRGIYVMDADGSNVQRLYGTRAGENCPAWSPDGTRIVFASWRDGDGEIYVMDADGSNLQKLTDNRFGEEFPAWRPAPGLCTQ